MTLDALKDERRGVRPLHWLFECGGDVRLGFRALRRERLFAASVTLILAVGIGTTVTMFSVLNGVVLRPLPYRTPGELVLLSSHRIAHDQFEGTAVPNMLDWRRQSASFTAMALYRRTSVSFVITVGADGPLRLREGLVGPGFFDLVGAPALIGRPLSNDDFHRAERVVVLSEALWTEQFGRSDSVLGRRLRIDGHDHEVIGVMPRSFQLPTIDTRLWRPLTVAGRWWDGAQSARDGDGFEVIGRLAPGVDIESARTEMGLIAARLRDAYEVNRDLDIRLSRLADHVVGAQTRHGLWLAFGAVLSLLAIVCANVGGLLTARAMRRRRELAVRAALGAARFRLIRQLLAEGVSLWVVGAVFGVALAAVLTKLLQVHGPPGLPRMEEIGLDPAAIAVALGSGFVVVTICSMVPALVASRADARLAFVSHDSYGPLRHRRHDVLVTVQVAGAMTLLVAAVLLARSFVRLQAEDPGYPAGRLAIVRIDRPASPRFFLEARERLERLPGVVAVGGITDFFIRRSGDQRVTIDGHPFVGADGRAPKLVIDSVTPGYFRAIGVAVSEGRDFTDADLQPGAPPVVIVSEAMARRFWPGEGSVGRRLVSGESAPADGRWATVIGVVDDMRREQLDTLPILSVFRPALLQSMDLTIRVADRVDSLIPAIRREIRALDPSLPVSSIASAEERLTARLGPRRFEAQAVAGFAGIALGLAGCGVYALLALQVVLRRREIAIRSALGATPREIVLLFVGRGVGLAAVGAVMGTVAAMSTAGVLRSQLYGTEPLSPRSYAAAASIVILVAACAAWWPARHAARAGAMSVLREEL